MEVEAFGLSKPNLVTALKDNFTGHTFTDVTLVTDDQIETPAHKCVLGACSPLLKLLLLDTPSHHPRVHLAGVRQTELQAILQFMYLGKAIIYQDRIDQILDLAKNLQLKDVIQCSITEYNVQIDKDDEDKVDDSGEVINKDVEKDDSECIYIFNMPVHHEEEVVCDADAVSNTSYIHTSDDKILQLTTVGTISKTTEITNVEIDILGENVIDMTKEGFYNFKIVDEDEPVEEDNNLEQVNEVIAENLEVSKEDLLPSALDTMSTASYNDDSNKVTERFTNDKPFQIDQIKDENDGSDEDAILEMEEFTLSEDETVANKQKTLTRKKSLKRQRQSVSELTKYKCNVCEYETKRKDHLKCHQKRGHKKYIIKPNNDEDVKIEEFDFNFPVDEFNNDKKDITKVLVETTVKKEVSAKKRTKRKKSLKGSRQLVSNLIKHCNICEYKTKRMSHLKRHQASVHEGIKRLDRQSDEGLQYSCDKCVYLTKREDSLKRHQLSKHEGTLYSCDQCEYNSMWPSSLREHKDTKHKGIRYYCDQCDYNVATKKDLTQHILSKHEGVRYPCKQCKFQTNRRADLRRHTRYKHEGVVFSCDKCEFQTSTKYYLNQHKLKIHENEVPPAAIVQSIEELDFQIEQMIEKRDGMWKCNVCDKASTYKNVLKNHAETHVKGVKHPCDRCNKTCATRNALLTHIIDLHSGLTFNCSNCGKLGMSKNGFKYHKQHICKDIFSE